MEDASLDFHSYWSFSSNHQFHLQFFFLISTSFGRLAEIKWSVCISNSLRILCFPFSKTNSGLCTNQLVVWTNFHFLYNSQLITFPSQSCRTSSTFVDIILPSFAGPYRRPFCCQSLPWRRFVHFALFSLMVWFGLLGFLAYQCL